MKVEIKQALLEGHTPEVIVEAVHANTVYEKGTTLGKMNRPELARSIKSSRDLRDMANGKGNRSIAEAFKIPVDKKFANIQDNSARLRSQQSDPNAWAGGSSSTAAQHQPRLYQAAKK